MSARLYWLHLLAVIPLFIAGAASAESDSSESDSSDDVEAAIESSEAEAAAEVTTRGGMGRSSSTEAAAAAAKARKAKAKKGKKAAGAESGGESSGEGDVPPLRKPPPLRPPGDGADASTSDGVPPLRKPPPLRPPSQAGDVPVSDAVPPLRPPPRRPGAEDGADAPGEEVDAGDAAALAAARRRRRNPNLNGDRVLMFDSAAKNQPDYTIAMSPAGRKGYGTIRNRRKQADVDLYNSVKAELPADDPRVGFDDAKLRIRMKGDYDTLTSEFPRAKALIQSSAMRIAADQGQTDGATSKLFDAAFISPRDRQILANSRRTQFNTAARNARRFRYDNYDETFNDTTADVLDGQLAAAGRDQRKAIEAVLRPGHKGFIVSEEHGDPRTVGLLATNMAKLKAEGVGTVYLEHFRHGKFQAEINDFLDSPAADEMPAALRKFVDARDGGYANEADGTVTTPFGDLLRAAKANGVRVVAIDDTRGHADADTPSGPNAGVNRTLLMNNVATDIINQDGAARADRGKYVALVGAAHTHTHEGAVPGLAQVLEVPAIRMAAAGGTVTHREDRALRATGDQLVSPGIR